jgi:preprotein translocase subunit SecA
MASSSPTSQGIPIVGPLLNLIIGSRNERFVKKYTSRVEAINALEPQTRALTDIQIRNMIVELRQRSEKGEPIGDMLDEALAVAREAMDRSVGIRNIFNPRFEALFDANRLPADARAMYDAVKAEIATRQPAPPTGEFLGCTEPQPGWLQVDIPPELYEAVRVLYPNSKPPFRARPFDVQLIGAMVLSGGKISEMKTGEGKTIVAPLACYLAAIEEMKVHVVTVNDYLVQRDRDWTYPYFHSLGMTVGAIHPMHMQPESVKRDMYKCDVVYGTTAEFGFDYLRDNMKRRDEDQVQRKRMMAVVDEVDSILIDEARTPLIISGEAHSGNPRYDLADNLAKHLLNKQKPWQEADDRVQHCMRKIKGLEGDIRNARDKAKIPPMEAELKSAKAELPGFEKERSRHVQYYEVELDRKQVHLTHDGTAEAQRIANVGSFYVGENMDLPHLLSQAVRAHVVYQKDRDYIIMPTENPRTGQTEPGIVIVDVNTGRPMIGRQWSDGLHQAVEAKEQVPIKQETQTVATVTIQNFFKMYKRLAGMTGTADTEAQEFHDIYHLDVVSIPTNLPVSRMDRDDLMFLAGKDKWDAITDEIKAMHDAGRPVLVGTTSVEKSETLSAMLTRKHGIKHEVLNAKPEKIAREADIVEGAGQLGMVMIATNMAGRGTDIKLGPSPREALLDHWLRRGIASRELAVADSDDQLRENVYRKIATKELDIPKHQVEQIPFPELETRLLRHWAMKFTMISPKKIDTATPEELRSWIDETGRFLLHRIRWFESVEDMGGLHVIGTERHESRRIDNQLRGRSGRQGDNGSSRFFVSLDDDLMKMFAGERTMKILSTLGMKEGDAIEHPMLSKSVERAQRKVEERNFQVRKNILEYDEVMEHQRQAFYGLRQRVMEGRDVRGLIFGYIRDVSREAVEEYLDREYPAKCASEFVRQKLDIDIFPARLRGLEMNEMDKRIRTDAKEEARQNISKTIGEYIPAEGGDIEIDFDAEGLASWARTHFGVELVPDDIRAKGQEGRRAVQDTLTEAAEKRIDEADLDALAQFADKRYGPTELCKWADNKFGIKITPEQVLKAAENERTDVENLILVEAESLYTKREIEYPVEFIMAMTTAMIRQSGPAAITNLVTWANTRYNMGWTPETVIKTPPQEIKKQLQDASKKFVESGELKRKIDEAAAITDHDAFEKHFKETLKLDPPENFKRLVGLERDQAIRARIESSLRGELLYFERTMLIETLDDLWKDHLYQMDQVRDSINYRAFSQQDPRIEFKREGSKLFKDMLGTVRDRITDFVFKLQLTPQFAPPPRQAPPPPRQDSGGLYVPPSQPQAAPAGGSVTTSGGGGGVGSSIAGAMISGPGLEVAPSAPPSDRAQRDLDAAQRAGTNGASKLQAQPTVKRDKTYGRNDTCPQGCGRKYKKCCNRADGICDGSGKAKGASSPDDGD